MTLHLPLESSLIWEEKWISTNIGHTDPAKTHALASPTVSRRGPGKLYQTRPASSPATAAFAQGKSIGQACGFFFFFFIS